MTTKNLSDNTIQKDEFAKHIIKTIEKISGVNILDTRPYSNFTLGIKPENDYTKADITTTIYLTEEQINRLIHELEPLAKA